MTDERKLVLFEEILAHAHREGRVLVTLDKDFTVDTYNIGGCAWSRN